jgi:hypothetical protein
MKSDWFELHVDDALEFLRGLPDRHVQLVFTSPPFEDRRRYGPLNCRRTGQNWVNWLRPIVVEMCRVSSGLVLLDLSAPVRQFRYSASVEWLIADLTRRDGLVCGPSPYCWQKNGTPGSGGTHYHRRDWNPIYAVARPNRLPLRWISNTEFGEVPQFAPGGAKFKLSSGAKVNQWGGRAANIRTHTRDGVDDEDRPGIDLKPAGEHDEAVIANPGNVLRIPVGGRRPGHEHASQSEAAMPPEVPERFICWFCPPGGKVLDPFCGLASTGEAALRHGRSFLGCDLREDQITAAWRRLSNMQVEEPSVRASRIKPDPPGATPSFPGWVIDPVDGVAPAVQLQHDEPAMDQETPA